MNLRIRQGLATIAAGVIAVVAIACTGAVEPSPPAPVEPAAPVAPATPASAPVTPAPAPVAGILPKPMLALAGLEHYTGEGKEWTRYNYVVTNRSEYPNEFFAAAPDLPPCGKNANASRTWVDFYDQDRNRLYGFCAISSLDQLASLWFAVEASVIPPKGVYIEMTDRKTDTIYRSNLAPTSRDPRLQ